MLLIEDDIHFIHTIRQPTTSTTSTAWHMCTALLDVQDQIPAVPKPPNTTKLHRIVPVTMKNGTVRQCRGGIDVAPVPQHFSEALNRFFFSSYLSSLPQGHKTLDMTNRQQSCENLHEVKRKTALNFVSKLNCSF